MMEVSIRQQLGRHNLCSNDKDWLVSVTIDGKSISETWPEDEEPDSTGSATEVIQMILDRSNSHWFSKSRDRIKALADKWLTNGAAINAAWAEDRIKELQRRSARLHAEIQHLRTTYLEQ